MKKILYISDFHLSELKFGGAEYNDKEIIDSLKKAGYDVSFINCRSVSADFLKKNYFDLKIISNFLFLRKSLLEQIADEGDYILYEHDHKYLASRNPAFHTNFQAPKRKIINKKLYTNALRVICQSSFQEKIIKSNLELNNTFNVSGNLWSDEDLEKIKELSKNKKTKSYSILNCVMDSKNTNGTIKFCENNDYNYELIEDENYYNFLEKISKNKGLVFLPRSPETLSRICVEAKMMGCTVITNQLVGAKYEDWFKKSGDEIISEMRSVRKKVVDEIITAMSEKSE